ncbi:unnamed protein product, partial [Brassica oleracea]
AGCSYIAAYTKACGRVDVDGSRHLLGDHAGLIHLLAITTHEKEKCVENNYGLNSSYKFVPRRIYIYIVMQKAHMYKSWRMIFLSFFRPHRNVTTRMQVIARPELDGLRLAIPSATRNFAVDRFVPYSIIVEHWNLKQHNPIEMITVPLIILMDVY